MLKLRDIMTRDVVSVTPDMSLREAMALFTARNISGAPVVEGGRLLGVLATSDLLALASAAPSVPAADAPESWRADRNDSVREPGVSVGTDWSVLDVHTVAEAMTADVMSLPSSAGVDEAGALMRRAHVHRVLVVDDGELQGIVSTLDIVRAVAHHGCTSRTYVFGRTGHPLNPR